MAHSAFGLPLVLLFIVAVVHGRSTSTQDLDRREDRIVDETRYVLRNHDEKDIVRIQNQAQRDRVDGRRDQDDWPEWNSRRHQNNNRRDRVDGRRQDDWPEWNSMRLQKNNMRDKNDDKRHQSDDKVRRQRNQLKCAYKNDDRRERNQDRRERQDIFQREKKQDRRDQRERNQDRRERQDDLQREKKLDRRDQRERNQDRRERQDDFQREKKLDRRDQRERNQDRRERQDDFQREKKQDRRERQDDFQREKKQDRRERPNDFQREKKQDRRERRDDFQGEKKQDRSDRQDDFQREKKQDRRELQDDFQREKKQDRRERPNDFQREKKQDRLCYKDDDLKQIDRARRPSQQEVILLGVHKPSSKEEDLRSENDDVLKLRNQVIVYDDGKPNKGNNDRIEVVRKDKTNHKDEVIVIKALRERRDVEDQRDGFNQSQSSENKQTKRFGNAIFSKQKPMSSFYSTRINSYKDKLHSDNHCNQQLFNRIINNINERIQTDNNRPSTNEYSNPVTSIYNQEINSRIYKPHDHFNKDFSHGITKNRNAFRQLQANNNTPYPYEYFNPLTSIYNKRIHSHNYKPLYPYDKGISHGIVNSRNAFGTLQADNNTPNSYEYSNPLMSIYNKRIHSHNSKPLYRYDQGISHGIANNRNDQTPLTICH